MSREGIVLAPLEGRTVGPPGSAFAMAEWADQGGPSDSPRLIAPLHVHDRDDEAWYVLEGRLRFRLGDREVEAPAGAAVFGPRGVSHTFWNPGPEPARYLVIMLPSTLRLIDELHSLTDRDPEAVRAVYRKHNCEMLT